METSDMSEIMDKNVLAFKLYLVINSQLLNMPRISIIL